MKRITISLLAGGCLGLEIDFTNGPCILNLFGFPDTYDKFQINEKLTSKLPLKHSACVKAGGFTDSQISTLANTFEDSSYNGDKRRTATCTNTSDNLMYAKLEYPLPKPGAHFWSTKLYSEMEQDAKWICEKLHHRKTLITNILAGASVSDIILKKSGAYTLDTDLRIDVHGRQSPVTVAIDLDVLPRVESVKMHASAGYSAQIDQLIQYASIIRKACDPKCTKTKWYHRLL